MTTTDALQKAVDYLAAGIVQRAMDNGVDADTYTTDGYAADCLQKYIALTTESHAQGG